MNAYTIHVNGEAYGGVDYGVDEPARPQMGTGFHHYGSGMGRDRLLFGGEPHVLHGVANLQSALTAIMARMRGGELDVNEIVVRRSEVKE